MVNKRGGKTQLPAIGCLFQVITAIALCDADNTLNRDSRGRCCTVVQGRRRMQLSVKILLTEDCVCMYVYSIYL